MEWVWTDDLAARIVPVDDALEERFRRWVEAPVALRLAAGAEAQVIADLLGMAVGAGRAE
jgi:hypothetical protein